MAGSSARARRGYFGRRILVVAAITGVGLGALAPSAHAANGSAVVGNVAGKTKVYESSCFDRDDLNQLYDATVTTSSGPAHLTGNVCLDFLCTDSQCFFEGASGTIKIVKSGRTIRAAVVGGSVGPASPSYVDGFGFDLVVRKGDPVLASRGTKLKFTGFVRNGQQNRWEPFKGKVARRP